MPQADSFQLFTRGALEHQEVPGVEVGNQHEAAIRRELQAVGTFGLHFEGLDHAFFKEADHRDAAISRVRRPELLAVGRDVETFGTFSHGNYSLVPTLRAIALEETDARSEEHTSELQ